MIDGGVTVSSTVVSIPEAEDERWITLTFTVEDADIRYRVTGTDPAGGNLGGHLVESGSHVTVIGQPLIKNLKMIRDASTDARVFYTLEK